VLKEKLRYEDTTIRREEGPPRPPGSITIHFGIVVARFGGSVGGVDFVAPFDDVAPDRMGPPVEFGQWWEPVIMTDEEGNDFSRKTLVLALANQDGGAHVAAKLRAGYAALMKANSLGFSGGPIGGELKPLLNWAYASVRQISHELQRTIEREIPHLVGRSATPTRLAQPGPSGGQIALTPRETFRETSAERPPNEA
jgi:hypothetical protein